MKRPWDTWSPWRVELVSGAALVLVIALVTLLVHLREPIAVLIAATLVSLLYELALDPNGWSLDDVAQREVGIAAGVLILWLLGRILA